ncbi:MAG: hypothetical protein KIS92_21910 [Planctomycetota bacterium]|nr:hypothetical protein [Planctomycetota bacterium]
MDETTASKAPWRRRLWLRAAGTLAAACAAYFMLYGFAVDRFFQAHHLHAEFRIQFDGFGFGMRPEADLESWPPEERARTRELYEQYATHGIKLPWVSEGPSNFFFAVGANLGFFAVGLSAALLASIWYGWMGPRFGLRALLSLVFGLGLWVTCLKLASVSSIEYARLCAAMPFVALGASMLVQRTVRKPDARPAPERTITP